MTDLNVERINRVAPYKIEKRGDEYRFESDYGIRYSAWFEQQEIPGLSAVAYWFNLSNRSQKPSPNDAKIRSTVIFILEEFFNTNPDVLLYMCDSADEQQAMRSRLFLRWFNAYGQQSDFYTRTELLIDCDEENYISLIVKRSHPQFKEIVEKFDKEIAMFRANKP